MTQPLTLGRTISRFRLLERLGGGAMSEVFRAEDPLLERPVVLKFLPPGLSRDPEAKKRLLHEAKAVSSCDHPNLCTIYEVSEVDDGRLFLVLAYYKGETLQARLARGRIDLNAAIRIARQIASGLAKAHEVGIIHRDIKPANVFLTNDGLVKILDFGIAKVTHRQGTGSGPVGTPAYMSPEQLTLEPLDARTDLWGLGVLLYEMLAGEHPFRVLQPMLLAILDEPPRPLAELRPDLPRPLVELVEGLLAKSPQGRPASAELVVRELDEILEPLASPLLDDRAPPRRRPSKALALTALLLLGLAVTAFLAWRRIDPLGDAQAVSAADAPRLAVLGFDNLSRDDSLDWLETGLAEMLVTDLSQSSGIHVLGTSRTYTLVEELHDRGERLSSTGAAQKAARAMGADLVVAGTVMRSGDRIRIDLRVEDTASGVLVYADTVEGSGEDDLFRLVDDLSTRIRRRLPGRRESAGGPTEADLAEVATTSIEAFRAYSEGVRLHHQFREEEAIVRLHEAVEIDPTFAVAWTVLSSIHSNLLRPAQARESIRQARIHAARLPAAQRLVVVGQDANLNGHWRDAITAYETALRLDPEHAKARNNLAHLQFELENFQAAILHTRHLLGQGTSFTGTYFTLAVSYHMTAREAELDQLLKQYMEAFQGDALAHELSALHSQAHGDLETARHQLERALELGNSPYAKANLCFNYVLEEDWPVADALSRELLASSSLTRRYLGTRCAESVAEHRGNLDAALARIRESLVDLGAGDRGATLHLLAGHLRLELGDGRRALEEAAAARADSTGDPRLAHEAMVIEALAREMLGEKAAADAVLAELTRIGEIFPGPRMRRLAAFLRGELLLARGDIEAARAALDEAASLLPKRGFLVFTARSNHAEIWFAQARAARAAGDLEDARELLDGLLRTSHERLLYPRIAVRSKELLAEIETEIGDAALSGTRPPHG